MEKSFFYYFGLITQLGIVVFISIFVGLFVGLFLDNKLGLKGPFTITCLIFGVIGGFKAAYELIKSTEKHDNPRT